MRLGQTSVIYFVSQVVASVIGFVATVYFTRTLGEDIYGFYAVTIALVVWLELFKSIGIGAAIKKRMSEAEEPDAYFTAGAGVILSLTIVIGFGVTIFGQQINAYVGHPVTDFVLLLLFASVALSLAYTALQGTHLVHIYASLRTVKRAVQSFLMVALVYIGMELEGMLWGQIVATGIFALVGFWIIKPSLTIPRRRHFIELIDFGKYAWLGGMRKKAFSRADILVLGLFVPAGLTGIYAVAYTLSEFLEIFGRGIKTTLFPEMSKLSAQDDYDMIATLTDDALTYAGLFLIPGVVGAAILGDRLMLVYGPGFDIGHWILVILLVGLLVYTYTKQLLNTLNAIDRPDLAFRSNGAFIIANIVLNLVLVWQIGWFGAAIATTVSAGIGFLSSFYYARKLIDVSLPLGEIGRQWIAAIAMGVAVYPTRDLGEASLGWVDDYNVVFVLLLVGLGAAIYFVVLFAISGRFRETVERNLPFEIPFLV